LSSAELLVRPRNTVVLQGQQAVLNCQTNSTAAQLSWKFTSYDGEQQHFIYNHGQLNPLYSTRNIHVDSPSSGVYDLVFNATDLRDAGTYTCQDGGGIGDAYTAWMAVLGEPFILPRCRYLLNTSAVTRLTLGRAHSPDKGKGKGAYT